jgi:hypothetical protein
MQGYDISTADGINTMFRALIDMDVETAGRRDMIETAGRVFWHQLNDENRRFHRWMFAESSGYLQPPAETAGQRQAERIGTAAYNAGMTYQDIYLID